MSSDDDDITRIEDIPEYTPEELDDDFLSLDDLANDMGLAIDQEEESEQEVQISSLTNNELEIPSLPDTEEDNEASISQFTSEFSPDLTSNEEEEESALEDFPELDTEQESFDSDFSSPPDFNLEEIKDESDIFKPRSEAFDDGLDESFNDNFDDNFNNELEESTNLFDEPKEDQDELLTQMDSEPEVEPIDYQDQDDEDAPEVNFEATPEIEEEELEAKTEELKTEGIEQENTIALESQDEPDTSLLAVTAQLTPLEELKQEDEELDTKPATKTPIDIPEKVKEFTAPERFEDIKSFSEKISYGNFASEGNPPFSVIIKDIKFHEDVDSICEILQEFKIIDLETLQDCKASLTRGQMLVPRMSEYAAITLCHKLRSFDIELLMGLTEELHPAKSYNSNDRGLSSKYTVYNNRKNHFNFTNSSSNDEVLTSTLPTINDYQIIKYLGIITETKQITSQDLGHSSQIEDEIINKFSENEQDRINHMRIKKQNIDASESLIIDNIFENATTSNSERLSLDNIYKELLDNLKKKVLQNEANGVVGINFSITPITLESYLSTGPKYQVLCTGNMVWLEKK